MKKVFVVLCMLGVFCALFALTGCLNRPPEEKTISINAVLKDGDFPKSKKGETLCYYYDNGKEISVYYTYFANSGCMHLKKYFADRETYELEKQAGGWDRSIDSALMLMKENAVTYSDPDAFFDQIENSSMYQMYK